MKPNWYALICRAVEEGTRCGLNRAYKYVDEPSREQLIDAIERELMNAICEVVVFDESEDA